MGHMRVGKKTKRDGLKAACMDHMRVWKKDQTNGLNATCMGYNLLGHKKRVKTDGGLEAAPLPLILLEELFFPADNMIVIMILYNSRYDPLCLSSSSVIILTLLFKLLAYVIIIPRKEAGCM